MPKDKKAQGRELIAAAAEASLIPTTLLVAVVGGYFAGGWVHPYVPGSENTWRAIGVLLGLAVGINFAIKVLVQSARLGRGGDDNKKK